MIPIYLFDNITEDSLEYKIVKYVNNNLKEIVKMYLDYLNANEGIKVSEKLIDVLPRYYIERKPVECRNLVDELYEIIESPFIREYIKPKYEYLLHEIMCWWIDICQEQNNCIPIELSDELKNQINDREEYLSEDRTYNAILQEISNFTRYLEFCFYDHDFLFVERLVLIYLKSLDNFNVYFQDVNLDDYVDLMPVDLRELYYEKKGCTLEILEKSINEQDTEEEIVKQLHDSLILLENNNIEIINKDEVEISNEIFRMNKKIFKLKFGFEIEREAQIGRANVKLGEADFFIYENNDNYNNIAVVENKLIDSFIDGYGQLLGYLGPRFKFGITVSINKTKPLNEAFELIFNNLNNIKDDNFKIINIEKNPFPSINNYIIRSEHILPEDKNRTMKIYHLVLNLFDFSREQIAKQSRHRCPRPIKINQK